MVQFKDLRRVHIASPGTPGGSLQLSSIISIISIAGRLWHFGQTLTWPDCSINALWRQPPLTTLRLLPPLPPALLSARSLA